MRTITIWWSADLIDIFETAIELSFTENTAIMQFEKKDDINLNLIKDIVLENLPKNTAIETKGKSVVITTNIANLHRIKLEQNIIFQEDGRFFKVSLVDDYVYANEILNDGSLSKIIKKYPVPEKAK